MRGSDWVTLIAFSIGMVALSFVSRETALIITGTVGLILVLRHYSNGLASGSLPGNAGNPQRS